MEQKNLFAELAGLVPAFAEGLERVKTFSELEDLRVEFLGRKGKLAQIMSCLPNLNLSERPRLGQEANNIKVRLNALFEERNKDMQKAADFAALSSFDPGLPGRLPWLGSQHPSMLVMGELCSIFERLGYDIISGREIETDYYNFEALNMPPEHPARDMQDTLYIAPGIVMRTHTSGMQVHAMLERKPPLAVIAPGKVYRRDSDLTHTPMFHQVEGLVVGNNITMADLRGTLSYMVRAVFGAATKVRFRPSFFPFTEPSAEVDISCFLCGGSGHGQNMNEGACRVCKGSGWVEILGSGMVDPAVFEAVGYNPEEVSGFAFGMGVERIAMLKYGIDDLRMFFENDVRFLSQFS